MALCLLLFTRLFFNREYITRYPQACNPKRHKACLTSCFPHCRLLLTCEPSYCQCHSPLANGRETHPSLSSISKAYRIRSSLYVSRIYLDMMPHLKGGLSRMATALLHMFNFGIQILLRRCRKGSFLPPPP